MQLLPGQRIVSIDPGRTTGLSQFRYLGGERGSDFELTCCIEITWEQRYSLREYLEKMDYIVIERFSLYESRAKSMINNEFPSVRIIGIVDAYAHDKLLDERIVFQPASMMKNVQVLPQHVALTKGSEHKKDSYKHGRCFIVLHTTGKR